MVWQHGDVLGGKPGQFGDFRSGITKRDIQRLQTFHNKAVQLIFRRDMRTCTKYLLREAIQFSIYQLFAFTILRKNIQIQETRHPKHYKCLFKLENKISRTRSEKTKRVNFRLNIARSSYFCQAKRLWSCLPGEVTEMPTIRIFKL